MLCTYVHTLSG